jgi:glycosyltransferase involved in cell wall biosynthesis
VKICLVGFHNLPVLAREYRQHAIGGESVQQTLLGRALARRGHEVSMVVGDYGQRDGAKWETMRVFKSYRAEAGVPVLRFIHPRWTGMWSALARADADLYYTSCAGMHVGLVALFCRRFRRRFVFRTASDPDCDKSRVGVLVRLARDRWLYALGLRRAHAILVQSASQAETLARSYRLPSRVAGMLVEEAEPAAIRDIDVLWVANIKRVKRPDRIVEVAAKLSAASIHMVGGHSPGEDGLFQEITHAVARTPNVVFHGRLPYRDANALYGRARVLVNTSDVEGFPNAYLQAWVRGVPVVTLLDPDGVIEREGLGVAVRSPDHFSGAISALLADPAAWKAASERCRSFMAREYGEDKILAGYLNTFDDVMRMNAAEAGMIASGEHHV